MVEALILLPALACLVAFLLRSDRWRRVLLVAVASAHVAGTAVLWTREPTPPGERAWVAFDRAGLFISSITSVVFLACSIFAAGYLSREQRGRRPDFEEGSIFDNAPEATFTGCMLMFLAMMTLVAASQHFGILWIAIEATTLATAPLIYFHRHHRSLEATWKYLLLCSVGIALALLGNFFLVVASSGGESQPFAFTLGNLRERAHSLHLPWLRAAFIFFLIGYGTKMGLAPLHSWKPDVYSEAPSVVAALFSSALSNCAFLGILRGFEICGAAGEAAFARDCLLTFGVASLAFAAFFIFRQNDYKRMLAYSSIEHMGILALGFGVGGAGVAGALFHCAYHSLSKASMFMVAGNVLATYKSKSAAQVSGLVRVLPWTGALWVAGFLAVSGSPPFATFMSEFAILRGAMETKSPWVPGAFILFILIAFMGMATMAIQMAQGPAPQVPGGVRRDSWRAVLPPAALIAAALVLGLWTPPAMRAAVQSLAQTFQFR